MSKSMFLYAPGPTEPLVNIENPDAEALKWKVIACKHGNFAWLRLSTEREGGKWLRLGFDADWLEYCMGPESLIYSAVAVPKMMVLVQMFEAFKNDDIIWRHLVKWDMGHMKSPG